MNSLSSHFEPDELFENSHTGAVNSLLFHSKHDKLSATTSAVNTIGIFGAVTPSQVRQASLSAQSHPSRSARPRETSPHSDFGVIGLREAVEQEEGPDSAIIAHCNSVDEFLGRNDDLMRYLSMRGSWPLSIPRETRGCILVHFDSVNKFLRRKDDLMRCLTALMGS